MSAGDTRKKPIDEKAKAIFLNNAVKLIELLELLEPSNHFLIAELYRNLGLFEESKIKLNMVSDQNKKRILLNEIDKNNRDVVVIKQPLVAQKDH